MLELVTKGIVKSRFAVMAEIESLRALMRRFSSVPVSLADACLVRMTRIDPQSTVVTMDRDIGIYRRNRRQSFR